MLNLYRTLKKTYVPYYGDGEGRDRYILYNGGGYFTNKNILSNPTVSRRTGTSFDTKINYQYKSPFFHKAPNFHYFGNGKGRETYVLHNGGGLYYDQKPLNSFRLADFLRSQESNKISTNSKVHLSKSQAKYNKYLKLQEKSIIDRLYEKEKGKFIKPRQIETEENIRFNTINNTNESLPKIDNINRNETYQNLTIDTNTNNLEKNF